MEIHELKGDLEELYRSRSSYWVPDLKSVCTRTAEWKLGPIFTERETYDHDDIYADLITEAAGVCVVTQVKGPQPGAHGIAKIRMQCVPYFIPYTFHPIKKRALTSARRIPNDPDIPSNTKPHNGSTRTGFEWVNLRDLTNADALAFPGFWT